MTRQIQQTQARHTRGSNAQFNLLSPEDLYHENNPPDVEVERKSDGGEVETEPPSQARLIDSLLPVLSHTGPEKNEMTKDIDSSNVDQMIEEIQPQPSGRYFLRPRKAVAYLSLTIPSRHVEETDISRF